MLTTRPATLDDLARVDAFRASDIDEFALLCLAHPEDAISALIETGEPTFVVEDESGVLGFFGVEAGGHVWMAGTDRIGDRGGEIALRSAAWLRSISGPLSTLVRVDSYTQHRFLVFLGFEPVGIVQTATEPAVTYFMFRRS